MQLHLLHTRTLQLNPALPSTAYGMRSLSKIVDFAGANSQRIVTLNPKSKPHETPPKPINALELLANTCPVTRVSGILGFIIMFVVPGALYYKSR